MANRSGKPSPFTAGRVMTRAELERLKASYLGIPEALSRKPRPFADASCDETRLSYARPVLHAMQAMDAAETPETQQSVLHGFSRYMHEAMAILKARLRATLRLTMREAISNGQRDDMNEDCAESAYLTERTEANRQRWIDSLVQQQQSSAVLEMHLRSEQPSGQQSPLRLA